MLHTITVEESTLVLLKRLQQIPLLDSLRLVGGTALSLQLGHRHSVDLDFFGIMNKTSAEIIDELKANGLNAALQYDSKLIKMFIINGVKVDIVSGHSEWFEPPLEIEGVKMAGLPDIAAMKLHAITGRGRKKDFTDLYFLLHHFSLNRMFEFYEKKYPQNNLFFVVRSISYFTDADPDPLPEMFIDVSWEDMKSTIQNAIRNL